MPRIRTVKPEFWTDPEILGLSFEARLFFIGLWNFADDYGNIEGHPIKLKSLIFPADPFSSEEITALLEELIDRDLLRPYELENKSFYNIRTFLKHQRINRRSTLLRNPPPPWDQEDSMSPPCVLREDSLPEGSSKGLVGEGIKSSVEKSFSTREPDSGSGILEPDHGEEKPPPVENEENQIWLNKAWLDATGKSPNNVQAKTMIDLIKTGTVTREQLEAGILETGKAGPKAPLKYLMAILRRIQGDASTATSEAVKEDTFKDDRRAAELAEAAWQKIEALPESGRKKIRAQAVRELEIDFKPEFILAPLIQAKMVELFQDPPESDPWD